MSILIKGMKMPKNCDNCDLIQFDDEGLEAHCPLSPYYRWCGTPPDYIPEGCRLVEIPTPHGRLIDAEKLAVKIWTEGHFVTGNDCEIAVDFTQSAPTIIEAEASE